MNSSSSPARDITVDHREHDFIKIGANLLENLSFRNLRGTAWVRNAFSRCRDCDVLPDPFWDGNTLVLTPTPCPYTESNAITSITIPVPSGRLVLGDMLNCHLDLPPEVDNLSVNATMNQVAHARAWGELGVAWAQVGDTSPSLYRRPDGTLVVGNMLWDDLGPHGAEEPVPDGWAVLGTVFTEIWCYSMMDLGAYFAHGGQGTDHGGQPITIVDVEPGDYEFTNFTHVQGWEAHPYIPVQPEFRVFTEVRRVPATTGPRSNR